MQGNNSSLGSVASLAPPPASPTKQRLYLAFAAIYLIWGSTYLAILYAIRTIPPLLMAGMRYVTAGSILYVWARRRGSPAPVWRHWRSALLVGGLLFLFGNGGLTWSEQRVPSGLAALILSIIPIWMALIHCLGPGGSRLSKRVAAGLALGLGGVALLVGPSHLLGGKRVDPVGAAVLLFASFCWALGSLSSRRAMLPSSTMMAAAIEMVAGGALLLAAGLASGEWGDFHLTAVTLSSLFGILYLVFFGAIAGFTSYSWLLTHSTPARVSTYAYVNPIVAVFLGWLLAGERVTPRTLVAILVVVSAVALIVTHRPHPASSATVPQPEESPAAIPPE